MLLDRASRRHLDYLEDEANAAAGTIKNYGRVERLFVAHLSETLGRAPATADLTRDAAREYLRWLKLEHRTARLGGTESGHSPSSVRFHLRVLSAWCSFLVDEEVLAAHPLTAVKGPKVPKVVPRVLSARQVETLLELCRANPAKVPRYRNMALFSFLAESGARITEACELERRDLTLASRANPKGRAMIQGKGAKQRWVKVGREASRAIKNYWDECRHDAEPWAFLTDDGRQLSQPVADATLKRLAEKADIDRRLAHCHAWRHFYAVQALREGMPLVDLQQRLGHASIRTTALYLQLLKDDPDTSEVSVLDNLRARRNGR